MTSRTAVLTLVLAGAIVRPGVAQTIDPSAPAPSDRASRGLFGGDPTQTAQQLSVSGTLGAAGYQFLTPFDDPELEALRTKQAWVGRMTGGLAYSTSRSLWGFEAQVQSAGLYDAPTKQSAASVPFDHNAGVNAHLQLSQRTRLSGQQSFGYAPIYFANVLPGQADNLGDPTQLFLTGSQSPEYFWRSSSNLSLDHDFSRRVSAQVGGEYQRSEGVDTMFGFNERRIDSGVHVGLTHHLGLHLGYGYVDSWRPTEGGQHFGASQIGAGTDFSRPLSATRRTTFSFETGGSILVDQTRTNRYVMTGRADLMRELWRTWSASVGFSREAGFVDALQDAVVTDTLTAGISGFLVSGLRGYVSAQATAGSVGFTEALNGYSRAGGSMGVEMRLTRNVGLGAGYDYFYSNFQSEIVLPAGFPARRRSQSFEIYATAWAPLFTQVRRPHATR